jgi:hypothetical protein
MNDMKVKKIYISWGIFRGHPPTPPPPLNPPVRPFVKCYGMGVYCCIEHADAVFIKKKCSLVKQILSEI